MKRFWSVTMLSLMWKNKLKEVYLEMGTWPSLSLTLTDLMRNSDENTFESSDAHEIYIFF